MSWFLAYLEVGVDTCETLFTSRPLSLREKFKTFTLFLTL